MTKLLNRMKVYLCSYMFPVVLAIPLSSLLEIFQKYIFADFEFVKWLVVLIVLDSILAIVFHLFKARDFSPEKLGDILVKLLIYGSLLILAHVSSTFTVSGVPVSGFDWFRTLICTSLIIREGMSIINNAGKIKPDLIPDNIKKCFAYFNENSIGLPDNIKNYEQK